MCADKEVRGEVASITKEILTPYMEKFKRAEKEGNESLMRFYGMQLSDNLRLIGKVLDRKVYKQR